MVIHVRITPAQSETKFLTRNPHKCGLECGIFYFFLLDMSILLGANTRVWWKCLCHGMYTSSSSILDIYSIKYIICDTGWTSRWYISRSSQISFVSERENLPVLRSVTMNSTKDKGLFQEDHSRTRETETSLWHLCHSVHFGPLVVMLANSDQNYFLPTYVTLIVSQCECSETWCVFRVDLVLQPHVDWNDEVVRSRNSAQYQTKQEGQRIRIHFVWRFTPLSHLKWGIASLHTTSHKSVYSILFQPQETSFCARTPTIRHKHHWLGCIYPHVPWNM